MPILPAFWLVNRPGELGDTVIGDQAIHFLGPGSQAHGPLDKLYVEPRHQKKITENHVIICFNANYLKYVRFNQNKLGYHEISASKALFF
jgi:hypothetical protein